MRRLNPAEFSRVESNLALLRKALQEPALEHLPEYVETLSRLSTTARLIPHDFLRDVYGDSLTGRLEFAEAILSARRSALLK